MRCQEALIKLADYSYGELNHAEELSMAVHLRDCQNCHLAYQELLKEDELYAQYSRDIDVTPQLWEGVMARINADSAVAGKQSFLGQASTRGNMVDNIFTFIEAEPFWLRFAAALQDAQRDFAADPKGFLLDLFRHDPMQSRRKYLLRRGIAVATMFWLSTSICYMAWVYYKPTPVMLEADASQKIIEYIPLANEPINAPKKSDKRAGGGGGGGNHELTPPSKGQPPKASMRDPIVAPSTHPPMIEKPELPVMPTIQVDPDLMAKYIPNEQIGLTNGVLAPPSDGPGSGKGIGTGKDGGAGSGDGKGLGPGHNHGTGGNYPGDGTGDNPIFAPKDINKQPQILSKAKPKYTEDARRDKVQGTVVLSAVFGKDGTISDVRVVTGIGYGLDEEAVKAATQIKFIPGVKDGKNVNVRARLEFTFSLL